jgi:hypothetical protein
MDGSLAISMQKEGFPGVLFCLGFHPLQLGRYLFTWLSRVLSDHHHCERQFQRPGSHPQGISDKPTIPHTTHLVVLVWQICVVAVAGVGKGRDPNPIPAALNLGTRERNTRQGKPTQVPRRCCSCSHLTGQLASPFVGPAHRETE